MAQLEKITGRAVEHLDRLVEVFREDEASRTAQIERAWADWAIEELIGAGQTYGQVAEALKRRGYAITEEAVRKRFKRM